MTGSMRFAARVLLFVSLVFLGLFSTAFATDYTVEVLGTSFDPPTITITQGDRVQWDNASPFHHSATSGSGCTANGIFTTLTLFPGDASPFFTFDTVGEFPYFCRSHCDLGMTGRVTVNAPVRVLPRTWGSVKALYAALSSP